MAADSLSLKTTDKNKCKIKFKKQNKNNHAKQKKSTTKLMLPRKQKQCYKHLNKQTNKTHHTLMYLFLIIQLLVKMRRKTTQGGGIKSNTRHTIENSVFKNH